ncbi:MAG: PEP-CTERM sorting domain-containing protein [Fimbriimonadales bacterium]|nr:PEP-CTERM sorting domain-containing protein [Fimbriimonadales bacterium]
MRPTTRSSGGAPSPCRWQASLAVMLMLSCVAPSLAQWPEDQPRPYHAPVRSPSGEIIYGDVHVGVGWYNGNKTMSAEFTFRQGFAVLDDFFDFHWFQIINSDTWPLNDSNGNRLTPPYVDTPNGGYQGQPSDDHPFYWDRDEWDDADKRVEGQFSRIWDYPNAPQKRDEPGEVLFKTFLVITDNGQDHFCEENVFGKILGFSWAIGSRRNNQGGLDNYVEFRGWIDIRAEKSKIQQAFGNSGFQGWDTVQVPEPSALFALTVGLAALLKRRRLNP